MYLREVQYFACEISGPVGTGEDCTGKKNSKSKSQEDM